MTIVSQYEDAIIKEKKTKKLETNLTLHRLTMWQFETQFELQTQSSLTTKKLSFSTTYSFSRRVNN